MRFAIQVLAAVLVVVGSLAVSAPPSDMPSASPSPLETPSASPSPLETPSPLPSVVATAHAWTIVTDQIDAGGNGDFSMPGHVIAVRENGDVSADRGSGNYKRGRITLYGHVVIHDVEGDLAERLAGEPVTQASSRGPATLTADQAVLDTVKKIY